MDKNLFQKAIEVNQPENKIYKQEVSKETLDFFYKYDVPEIIIDFLKTFSFNSIIKFKHVYFYKVNEIPDNNLDEANKVCISERLLIVGSGLNGDPIVIDLNTLTVGYVFHDELWENDEVKARDIFVNLNCSLGEFYYKSLVVDNYPVDGFAAEEYVQRA